jgi:Flp pilus assembly protein TadD
VAELGVQAAEALDHAHQAGIVHRDVKPGNLLLDGSGRLWVTDFGLAHVQHGEAGLTLTGDLVGTLRYMSPEQALAKRVPIDHRTDVYSLGATLYELLTLRHAFPGTDRQELLRQIANEESVRPRSIDKAIPAELETITLKALEKNPADRYATAQEMADDLRRWLDDKPIRARRPSWRQMAVKWARRHRSVVWAAAVVIVVTGVLAGGNGVWLMQKRAAAEVQTMLALGDTERFQSEGRWPEAIGAIRPAAALAKGGALNSALTQQVLQRQADLEMAARLDAVVLEAQGETGLDHARADEAFAAAFADYGLDLKVRSAAEAVERIKASTIRTELIVSLDLWAVARDHLPSGGSEPLPEVARLADEDPWRRQLRDPSVRKDAAALKRLAQEPGTLIQPPAHLVVLATALHQANEKAVAVDLLRQAQEAHPADWWLITGLATVLGPTQDGLGFWRAAQVRAPLSPGIWNSLGVALRAGHQLREAEHAFRKAIALKADYADAYNNLGVALKAQGDLPAAEKAYRKAIELKPNSPAAWKNLGNLLLANKKPSEAESACRKAIDLKPDYADAYFALGIALHQQGKLPEAEKAYHQAIDCNPNHAEAHNNLGALLESQQKMPEAERAYRKAVELRADFADAWRNLGDLHASQGNLSEAEDAFRKAIHCQPRNALAHAGLGNVLMLQGIPSKAEKAIRQALDLDPNSAEVYHLLGALLLHLKRPAEAEKACLRAIELRSESAEDHHSLGVALYRQDKLPEAEDALRKATRFGPKNAEAHNTLGNVLIARRRFPEAEKAFRKATKLKPDFAIAFCSLGDALAEQGRFSEALVAHQKGHQLGTRQPGWDYPSAQWVRDAARRVELDAKLPAVLTGKARPADAAERLDLAQFCRKYKSLYTAAAQFSRDAFTAEPKLAGDLRAGHRYNAACDAALSADGQGKDATGLDDQERSRWRRQSLDWLRADLDAWRRLLEKEPVRGRPVVAEKMRHWLADTDLAAVRGPEALDKLPEAERPAWRELWADIEKTLDKAQGKAAPKEDAHKKP